MRKSKLTIKDVRGCPPSLIISSEVANDIFSLITIFNRVIKIISLLYKTYIIMRGKETVRIREVLLPSNNI